MGEEVVAQIKRRTGITLGGLQQALESLVRLRGQKSLALVSEGFLLLPRMPGYQRGDRPRTTGERGHPLRG